MQAARAETSPHSDVRLTARLRKPSSEGVRVHVSHEEVAYGRSRSLEGSLARDCAPRDRDLGNSWLGKLPLIGQCERSVHCWRLQL